MTVGYEKFDGDMASQQDGTTKAQYVNHQFSARNNQSRHPDKISD
jgi:hypothetical protein